MLSDSCAPALRCAASALRCAASALLAGAALGAAEPAPARDPQLSPFGIATSATRSREQPKWMPQIAAIGLRDMRSCGIGWMCQADDGTWTWTALDQRLDYLDSVGVTTGMIFHGLGKLNTKDQKGGLPINSLPEWSTMVGEVVKHTAGRVKHFECWNEPPNGTKNAPPSDYAKVVMATYDAAKAANPEAQVGMAAKSAHITYLDQAIKAGAKGHFDYITLHPYEILGTIITHPGSEPIFMAIAPTVRKMLKTQDPAKADAPIWFTEIGYDSKRSNDKQAQAVVKAYTMGIAQGIACINWYEGMDGDDGLMGLLDIHAKPRPSYTALSHLIQHLGRHPGYLGWILLKEKHYGFVFQGAAGTVLATWAATATPDEVNFGQAVHIVEPATGKASKSATWNLSADPILVVGVPDALVAQAKANMGNPFPWDGDYSGATSVSVTYGEHNIEKGLHTKSADTIAADVLAYGGNARVGTVPGGTVFMVDPNFLSYDTVPIEITALVRRNEKNEAAKIELEYESTTGYKKPAAFEIPDNSQWHKATWRLDDVQFVGTWAFNFRIAKGLYGIQSVTVTKLGK